MPQGPGIREDHHLRSSKHAEGAAAGHGGNQQAGAQRFCLIGTNTLKDAMSQWASSIW